MFTCEVVILYKYREGLPREYQGDLYKGKLFWWFPQSPGVYCGSLFSPQGLSAEPHDLGSGGDPFSSPGQ